MKKILLLALILIATASHADAATYNVIKAGGGDYTTIQTCANAAVAGDTCLVWAGDYDERVAPTVSGTVGNPITFRATTTTARVKGWTFADDSYITVDGFEITRNGFTAETNQGASDRSLVYSATSTGIVIKNNIIHDGGGQACIMQQNSLTPYGKSNNWVVQNNQIYHCGVYSSVAVPGMNIFGDDNLIERNTISHNAEDYIRFTGGDKLVIRYNILGANSYNDANKPTLTHIDGLQTFCSGVTPTLSRILFEGNIMKDSPSVDTHAILMQNTCNIGDDYSYSFIGRYNILYNVGEATLTADDSTPHAKMYNNTVFRSMVGYRTKFDFNAVWSNGSTYGAFVNNLMIDTVRCAAPKVWSTSANTVDTFRSNNNLYYNTYCPDASWQSNITGELNSQEDVNPLFVATSTNFNLQSTSPAIEAGGPLATTTVADTGTGTELLVNDAQMFQDGWSGVSADWIAVGSASNIAQIVSIATTTHAITLDRSLERNDGDAVYLYRDSTGRQVLGNTVPDIGACEWGMATSTCIIGNAKASFPTGTSRVNFNLGRTRINLFNK